MFATTQQRRSTDRGGLYFFAGSVVLLLVLFSVNFYQSNISIMIDGYDDCGNICGQKNENNKVRDSQCKAEDMTSKPYTLLGKESKVEMGHEVYLMVQHATCVAECPKDYFKIGSRCLEPSKETNELEKDLEESVGSEDADFQIIFKKSWGPVLISIMVSFVFSFGVLFMFRYAIKQIIWGIYIGLISIFFLFSIGFIVAYVAAAASNDRATKDGAIGLLIPAGVFGILGVISAVVLYLFRHRIKLVVQIFKEASKVLRDVATLLFEPILTFISLILSFIIFVYYIVVIQNACTLHEYRDTENRFIGVYETSIFQHLTHALNAFIFYWFLNFILGCQHFVIASTVSQWYFTRDKTKLESPLKRAFGHLLNFHIGSVCLGSLLITIVKIILGILRAMTNSARNSDSPFARILAGIFQYMLDMLEQLLEFLLRNAYIIVALEGTDMFSSGKRAIKLLKENLLDVVALNQFGDIVMVVARIFVAALAGILCYTLVPEVNGKPIGAFPAFFTAVIAFLIIHCFMTVFEMAVDTIFICFCVDCEQNDGSPGRQYYMSPKLMRAMQEIKEAAGGSFNFGNQPDAAEPLNPQDPPPKYGFNV